MTSEAAIAGISAHGLRWRHRISLAGRADAIGEMDESTPESEINDARTAIVSRVKNFIIGFPENSDMRVSVEDKLDDLETVDAELEEVRFALGELYDAFDYYRIVVVG
jgi:hypothetical protein